MFKLTKNEIMDTGLCIYKDEYGNVAKFKRVIEEGFNFTAKFTSVNGAMKTLPLKVEMPAAIKMDGVSLNFEKIDAERVCDDDKKALQEFVDLISRWISMMNLMSNFILVSGIDNQEKKHEMYNEIVGNLKQYNELEQMFKIL